MAARTRRRRTSASRRTAKHSRGGRRAKSASWVARVRERSDAMDLPPGIFKGSPRAIAAGLKRAVMQSRRTKGTKFQSAMSMLNLYVNRTGKNLGARDRQRLNAAKEELRRVFGRAPQNAKRAA